MKDKTFKIIVAFLAAVLSTRAIAKDIAPDNPSIIVSGARYAHKISEGVEFLRFSPDVLALGMESGFNPEKARTTTGVQLSFKTDSPKIQLHFQFKDGDYNRGSQFIISQNGRHYKEFNFTPKDNAAVLDINSDSPGKAVVYTVLLPVFANPILVGMTIEDDSKLIKLVPSPQKVYVAIGDSITHGTGQKNSAQTYPYQLASKLNLDLYNMAVGGGKISVTAAECLKDWDKIDLITILIGYNDLHFAGKKNSEYREQYSKMLEAIRKNHPETKIFCISLLFTRKNESVKTGATTDQYRNVVTEIVKARQIKGDNNIFLIEGGQITSEKNLRGDEAPTDPVHMGIEGAAMFADELFEIVRHNNDE
jgi:lysophospholipase L1-like esterase